MLRRLNVRTRLVVVIAVPLTLVLVVAVLLAVTSSGSPIAYLGLAATVLVFVVVLALAVARSISAVEAAAAVAAREQDQEMKKGVSELYVNLARRNQALIDRQIRLLDELESGELDDAVLEHLYLLDHLATRMRRNAESLLVLAGSEPVRRRSKSIGIVDVVRAAVSEIEDYTRVELGGMGEATLHGPAVSDVAHLVAELLENATQLSPPATQVRVEGTQVGGSYRLTITDRGVGMPVEKRDELNLMFREPPVSAIAQGRSLGCLVAARLAARHGIAVRLDAGEREGTVATLMIPALLLVEVGVDLSPDPQSDERSSARVPAAGDRVPTVSLPTRLREARPAHAAFEADIAALFESEAPAGAVSVVAPQSVALLGVVGGVTATVQRRLPGASTGTPPETLDARLRARSPDDVRDLLSRYRAGLEAGRRAVGSTDEDRS